MSLDGIYALSKIFKGKRERQPNWTESEKQFLLTQTTQHRAILENKGSDSKTIKRKSAAWDEITYNMNVAGYHRTKERLKQQLGRIKSAEAKKIKDSISIEKTENGPANTQAQQISVDRCMSEKIYDYVERTINAKHIAELNSKLKRKSCMLQGGGEAEERVSSDDFEDIATLSEATKLPVVEDAAVVECPKLENEVLMETNTFLPGSYNQLNEKNLEQCHSAGTDNNSEVKRLNSNRRKNLFERRKRSKKLQQIRITIERERLLALRLQRKRDDHLYQKEVKIKNMKMQILQNLINQNKYNRISL